MAEQDVQTSTKSDDTSILTIEEIARQALAEPRLSDNDRQAIEWTLDSYLEAKESGINQAQTAQNLETALSNIDNPVIAQRIINLSLQGAAEMYAGVATKFGQNETAEQTAERKARNAHADNVLIQAAADAAYIDPETKAHLDNHLRNNWTQKLQKELDEFNSLFNRYPDPDNMSPEDKENYEEDFLKIKKNYDQELHQIMMQNETYANLTPEQQNAYRNEKFLDEMAKQLGIAADPENITDRDRQKALIKIEAWSQKLDTGEFREWINTTQRLIENDNNATHTANLETKVSLTKATSIFLGSAGVHQTPETSEPGGPEKAFDDFVQSIQTTVGENGEEGSSLSDEIDSLRAEIEKLSIFDHGMVSRQIQHYESRVASLENQFDQITNMNGFLFDVMDFVDENKDFILNSQDPNEVITLALQNDELMASYQRAAEGMDPTERREVFIEMSTKLGLSNEQASAAYEAALNQEAQIFQLRDLKMTLRHEVDPQKAEELRIQISQIQNNLFKLHDDKSAELEKAKENLQQAQELSGEGSLGDLLVDVNQEKVEKLQEEKENLEDAIGIETAGDPEPTWNEQQAFIDRHSEEISAILSGNQHVSREGAAQIIQRIGNASEPKEPEISFGEATKIVDQIVNNPANHELAKLSPALSESLTQTAQDIAMTPAEIAAEAAKPAANVDGKPYDVAVNDTAPLPGNQM